MTKYANSKKTKYTLSTHQLILTVFIHLSSPWAEAGGYGVVLGSTPGYGGGASCVYTY